MHIYFAAATQTAHFDPSAIAGHIKALLFIGLTLVLIWISLTTAMSHGKRGNMRGAWDVSGATLLAMIPAALALGGFAIAIIASGFNWFGIV